ncbi:MAG: hypothetical protein AB7V08_14840 [Elusimicrobiales bacterium]
MGLDVYLYDGKTELGDVPSDKYPDHLFQKTYLRSSYNEAGFNSVVWALTGKEGLYYIFQPPQDEYEIPYSKEDLAACRGRALEVLEELKRARPLYVMTVGFNPFIPVERYKDMTARKAVEVANKELDRVVICESKGPESNRPKVIWYLTRDGHFFVSDPPKLVAAVPGVDALGMPAVHLVYEASDADKAWYIQATEIVVEFIDYAMTLDAPVLHWSA